MNLTDRHHAVFARLAFVVAIVVAIPTLVMGSDSNEGAEQRISFDQLPQQVQQAAKLALKSGRIEKVTREVEGGKTLYELEAEVKGGKIELVYNDQGVLLGIEVEDSDDQDEDAEATKGKDDEQDAGELDSKETVANIKLEELPSAAKDAIVAKAAGANMISLEAITQAGVTVYEAAWMEKDAKLEVTVTKTGDTLSSESSLALNQLPKSLQTLATKFAKGRELKIESKTIVVYELEFEDDGEEVEIYADAAGRVIEIETLREVDSESHNDEQNSKKDTESRGDGNGNSKHHDVEDDKD